MNPKETKKKLEEKLRKVEERIEEDRRKKEEKILEEFNKGILKLDFIETLIDNKEYKEHLYYYVALMEKHEFTKSNFEPKNKLIQRGKEIYSKRIKARK